MHDRWLGLWVGNRIRAFKRWNTTRWGTDVNSRVFGLQWPARSCCAGLVDASSRRECGLGAALWCILMLGLQILDGETEASVEEEASAEPSPKQTTASSAPRTEERRVGPKNV